MKQLITLLLLGWIPFACVKGQLHSVDVSKLAQYRPDTLYYPFYNEVQMIAIGRVSPWRSAMESMSMRSMNYTNTPPPQPNIYLFRHSSGNIVAAYNTHDSLAQWARLFKNKGLVPAGSHTDHRMMMGIHARECNEPQNELQPYLYANYEIAFCNGYYLVYGDLINESGFLGRNDKEKVKDLDFGDYRNRLVGLIDSFGTIQVPPVYKQIRSVGNHLLVQNRQGAWGIMDKHLKNMVPFAYDDYESGHESLREYCFLIKKKSMTCTISPRPS